MAIKVKAREIREKLQGKVAPDIIDLLCRMAENDKERYDQIHLLAQAYDRLTDQVILLMKAAGTIAESQTSLKTKLGLAGQSGKGAGVDVRSIEASDDEPESTH